VTWSITLSLALLYTEHTIGAMSRPVTRKALDRTRLKIAAALAVATAIPALVGQIDKPLELQPTAVWTADNGIRLGYYVASLPQGLFLGADGQIMEIPRRRIEKVHIWQAPSTAQHPSLVSRVVRAVIG
jgi:hypothetical protein